jgi:NAD(P)-dependent dehydrogenase (short-subunit alcohol dehydrogenase family)
MSDLDGKVALVTGAGQGVGRGIALALANEGATVAAVGRTMQKVERTAEEIRDRAGAAVAFCCDVADRDQVHKTVAEVGDRLGSIDVLVNNASGLRLRPVLEITPKDLEVVWTTSFVGTLTFMQACFDYLKARRGAVINVGSGAGLRSDPAGMGLYASVKEAIRTLTRVAAVEWGPLGIRVNTIVPFARSPSLEVFASQNPNDFARVVESVPLRRIGDCEDDIGRAVAFLAGPAAGYITGTTLMLDGGQAFLR